MSTTIITPDGKVKQLDRRPGATQQLTVADVQDPEKLARELNALRSDAAERKRTWSPRIYYFRDVVVDATGTTIYRLRHKFGGRVNFEVASWTGVAAPALSLDASTDGNTLALVSKSAGTVTVRVEEAG